MTYTLEINRKLEDLNRTVKSQSEIIDFIIFDLIDKRGFMTLNEARRYAYDLNKYCAGVYQYRMADETRFFDNSAEPNSGTEDLGYTLIEDKKVLIEGVNSCHWYEKGVYSYEIKEKGWTLVENDNVVIEGVEGVEWYKKGVYMYRIKNKGWTLIEDRNVLFEGAPSAGYKNGLFDYTLSYKEVLNRNLKHQKYNDSTYKYKIEGKGWTLIEDNRLCTKDVIDVQWYEPNLWSTKINIDGKISMTLASFDTNGWRAVWPRLADVEWYAKGHYKCTYNNGNKFEVKDGIQTKIK